MKRLTTVTSVCVLALVLSLFIASVVSAQASSISTGVVTSVETGDDGGLTAFSIVGRDGGVLRFIVSSANPNTEFGLENRVGDRWVSDQASNPREAANRLRDQQSRLTKISVQSDANGVAVSVVQAASTDVDANLGYLFAVVAIAWIAIMAYVVYLGVRQRTISADLASLRDESDNES